MRMRVQMALVLRAVPAWTLLVLIMGTCSHAASYLPRTGQTECWDEFGSRVFCTGTGQDGEHQAGSGLPSQRFTDDGNGTLTDNMTGLAWTKDANPAGKLLNWRSAFDFIADLNRRNYLGHDDWRLPNINELQSMVDRQLINSAEWLNSQGFTNVQTSFYWSSTTYTYTQYQLAVNMYSGVQDYRDKITNIWYVWPVRGASNLPRTGQSSCWDYDASAVMHVVSCTGTGQDGEVQAGVAWPNPRFSYPDGGSGSTVLDNLTALEWVKSATPPAFAACMMSETWQGALDYVMCLNRFNYLGHNDWRMPNVSELASLLNRQYKSSDWLNVSGFTDVNTGTTYYWSSSTMVGAPGNAWEVRFSRGDIIYETKSTLSHLVLPVRAGRLNVSAPRAPIIISAVPGNGEATLFFSAPVSNGGSAISGYTVTASPGNLAGTGTASPITLRGLANGSAYTFTITATNATGTSPSSKPSQSVTPGLSVAGVCGPSMGMIYTTAPAGELCYAGTASGITTGAQWSWTCGGLNGGDNASCSARVASGVIRVPRTGQTSCFWSTSTPVNCIGTGQDGENATGSFWPDVRFTDNGDQTMTDNLTGLTWSQNANPPSALITWYNALDYVKNLNSNNYLGHNDWRMPNANEVASLMNRERANTASWLSSQGFTYVTGNYYYLTSTTQASAYPTVNAWMADLWHSQMINYVKAGGIIWPVRGTSNLSRTGQTGCWDFYGNAIQCAGTGQDGELQAGVAWPEPRFTNPNGSGPISETTILDRATGLQWPKEGSTPSFGPCVGWQTDGILYGKSWSGALNYVSCLNSNNYLGYNDWRLPNLNELTSLYNRQAASSAVWLDAQGFSNIQSLLTIVGL